VSANATFTAPALTSVSGSVYVSANATFTAPALTSVSGSVYVRENATFTAPALTQSGYVDVSANATFTAPALTQSGYVYVSANATFTAPALTSVSGSVDVSANATINIKQLKNLKYKSVDNSLFVIESEKTSKGIKILTGYNVLKIEKGKLVKQPCYVAEKDNFFAHGETVKKAIQDLNFKIIAEKLNKEPIKADTIITVEYYRIVTGACLQGCQSWIKQNGITKTEYKAKDLLPLLEKTHAYGYEKFKSLITF
jgi:hypothetical protein